MNATLLILLSAVCGAQPGRQVRSTEAGIPALPTALGGPQAASLEGPTAAEGLAPIPAAAPEGVQAQGAAEAAGAPAEASASADEPREGRLAESGRRIAEALAAPLSRAGEDWAFPGWEANTFTSAYHEAPIHYQTQKGAHKGPATVFVGGVGLAESFDSLFATDSAPRHDRLFLVLRGNHPSPWVRTPDIFDADAQDLAHAISLAKSQSGHDAIHLAAHSYSTLAFQRLIQRRDDPEVKEALEALRGGEVTLVTGATLYDGHHVVAGDQYEGLMAMMQNAVAELDAVETAEASTKLFGGLFPFWNPMNMGLNVWSMTRDVLLSESTMGVSKDAEEFSRPWAPEIDHIRRYLKERRIENARQPDWQEALVRRTVATSTMNFTKEDVAAIKALGLRVNVVYAHDDQLIPWTIGQLLPQRLGIEAPKGDVPPPAGSVLKDDTGLFTLHVVAGDHYFPLKHPAELKKILDGKKGR